MPLSNEEHFDRISGEYENAVVWAEVYEQIEAAVPPLIHGKDVLDIGNGGYFAYDPSEAKTVTALDISPRMLDRIDMPNVRKVVGDARVLELIPPDSVDIILYIFNIHHIQGKSYRESVEILDQLFRVAETKLREGGEVFIVEPCTSGVTYWIQRLVFPITRLLLKLARVPMIFFHHGEVLRSALSKSFHVSRGEVELRVIALPEGKVDPFSGSFPGILNVPVELYPAQNLILRAVKPSASFPKNG